MSKGLIFFCCACAILIFTIINLSVGYIITNGGPWGTENCQSIRDSYNEAKDLGASSDDLKYNLEWKLNECDRKKGMNDMEYTSFIFNMAIGFVCGLLGLLHLFDVKKEFVSKTGLIGLGCGIVGFIFSFVYVIFNGLVYTTVDTGQVKRDSDGAFAERLSSGHYKCIYYDSDDNWHALQAKISDLIKKQYNYDKDFYEGINGLCIDNDQNSYYRNCYNENSNHADDFNIPSISGTCKYIYAARETGIRNKDISDRFLTTLLLSLFVCLANIGLAIFGFLLFRTPGEF